MSARPFTACSRIGGLLNGALRGLMVWAWLLQNEKRPAMRAGW
jgi:uncharacterized membrane protein